MSKTVVQSCLVDEHEVHCYGTLREDACLFVVTSDEEYDFVMPGWEPEFYDGPMDWHQFVHNLEQRFTALSDAGVTLEEIQSDFD